MADSLGSEAPRIIRQLSDSGRTIYFMMLRELSDWPSRIELSSRHFGVLLLCDGRTVSNDAVFSIASRMISQGLAYLCAWGPDCERIHDLFDEELVGDGGEPTSDNPVVMTTWHDEPMEDAVWYSLYLTVAAGHYEKTCRSWIIVPVARQDWAEESLRLAETLELG